MAKRTKGTMAQLGLDPVTAAKKRIAVCEQFGLDVDPRDVEIVEAAGA